MLIKILNYNIHSLFGQPNINGISSHVNLDTNMFPSGNRTYSTSFALLQKL